MFELCQTREIELPSRQIGAAWPGSIRHRHAIAGMTSSSVAPKRDRQITLQDHQDLKQRSTLIFGSQPRCFLTPPFQYTSRVPRTDCDSGFCTVNLVFCWCYRFSHNRVKCAKFWGFCGKCAKSCATHKRAKFLACVHPYYPPMRNHQGPSPKRRKRAPSCFLA